MYKKAYVNLPLHSGNCPKWLFPRMKRLGSAISETIINEYNTKEFLKRISNPYFFQAFGCILGFDWHSSGLTTTTLGALKQGLKERNLGIVICGGKGKASRKTLEEIKQAGDRFSLSDFKIKKLVYASRIIAKVDNNLIQDNYELYHHCFIFDEKGNYSVIQQGMNNLNSYARRYHWLSFDINSFIETNNKVCCDVKQKKVLNLTSKKSKEARKISLDIVRDKEFLRFSKQRSLNEFFNNFKSFTMKKRHFIAEMDKRNIEMLKKAYELQPKSYEELVSIKGVGAKALRSLALISNLIYGSELSWEDPVKYSFAHGGKDGIPYPVDKKLYDNSIDILEDALRNAKIGKQDKLRAIKKLRDFFS